MIMDITKRLEIKSNMIFLGEKIAFGSECALMDEATIEIQTLRTKVAELEHCVENRAKQWAEQRIKIADQAATIAQLELDNARMREVLLKVRSIYTDSLNYKWITEALATQPTEIKETK